MKEMRLTQRCKFLSGIAAIILPQIAAAATLEGGGTPVLFSAIANLIASIWALILIAIPVTGLTLLALAAWSLWADREGGSYLMKGIIGVIILAFSPLIIQTGFTETGASAATLLSSGSAPQMYGLPDEMFIAMVLAGSVVASKVRRLLAIKTA